MLTAPATTHHYPFALTDELLNLVTTGKCSHHLLNHSDMHIGMIQQMMGAFTGSHQIEQLISEGEWVVVRGRWSGKHTGEFNGIPASGKPVSFTITDIMHVVNDKVTEEFMEWNAMTLMTQIGAMPQ